MKIRLTVLELLHGNIEVNRQIIANLHNRGSNKILKGKREHTNNERELGYKGRNKQTNKGRCK
jgi:hypothetical protein